MNKSKLTPDQIKHIAKLANLNLTLKDLAKFQQQLSKVLDYFEILNNVDTTGVEPTSQVTGLENVFKNDQIQSSLTSQKALSGTKSQHQGYFKVKSIFNES